MLTKNRMFCHFNNPVNFLVDFATDLVLNPFESLHFIVCYLPHIQALWCCISTNTNLVLLRGVYTCFWIKLRVICGHVENLEKLLSFKCSIVLLVQTLEILVLYFFVYCKLILIVVRCIIIPNLQFYLSTCLLRLWL